MNQKIKIRKNGEYYQLGFRDGTKWIQIKQLGNAQKILEMVKRLEDLERAMYQIKYCTKNFPDLEPKK